MEFPIPFPTDQTGGRTTKHEAVYRAIKQAITEGKLIQGSRLPSSRELAGTYSLSRGTVHLAYEMLAAEGYVQSKAGSGTYVAFGEAEAMLPRRNDEPAIGPVRLSTWGSRLDRLPAPPRSSSGSDSRSGKIYPDSIRFTIGQPDLTSFPAGLWAKYLYAQVRELNDQPASEQFEAAGHYGLREAIARHLGRARAISAHPDQIVIVNGSMQAIAIIVQLLVDAGDPVVLENPGYRGFRRAVKALDGHIIAAPIDGQGLIVQDWQAKLAFVTPGRQFPTGEVMAMERRLRLLNWANEQDALIIEDDYDTEFRHKGKPLEPLKALDRGGRVVFVGTFSKTMLPYLRIGYAVLPHGLKEPFLKAKQLFEPSPSSLLEQRALAQMMNSGHYEKHLRKMRRLYSRKYSLLTEGVKRKLAYWLEPVDSDAGLHLFAWWKGSPANFSAFRHACKQAGVEWSETEPHFAGKSTPSVCLGFSHLNEEEIEEGLRRMEKAAARVATHPGTGMQS